MVAFQEVSGKGAEVAEIAAGFVSQAASGLVGEAESLSSDEMSRRLGIALRALRGEDVFKSAMTSYQTARKMLNSYTFDSKTGVSTFTVPAGVSDVEAMKALNFYYRQGNSYGSDLVHSDYLEFFETLPKKYPDCCQERDYSHARQITITAVVKGTAGKDRSSQERILKEKSLVFADPRDQALAAAIHSFAVARHYVNPDNILRDLFRAAFVRGSLPDIALSSRLEGNGVGTLDYNDDHVGGGFDGVIAASGTPAPRAK